MLGLSRVGRLRRRQAYRDAGACGTCGGPLTHDCARTHEVSPPRIVLGVLLFLVIILAFVGFPVGHP